MFGRALGERCLAIFVREDYTVDRTQLFLIKIVKNNLNVTLWRHFNFANKRKRRKTIYLNDEYVNETRGWRQREQKNDRKWENERTDYFISIAKKCWRYTWRYLFWLDFSTHAHHVMICHKHAQKREDKNIGKRRASVCRNRVASAGWFCIRNQLKPFSIPELIFETKTSISDASRAIYIRWC